MVKESNCNAGDLQEKKVGFLGWEDPLEKGMAIHFSILAWEHGQRSLAGCSPWIRKRFGHNRLTMQQLNK